MKVVKNFGLLLGAAWVVFGLAGSTTAESPTGNTSFALDLYEQLKASEGNQCFSPHSLSRHWP